MRGLLTGAFLAALAGCGATPEHELRVTTLPEGAACGFHREDEPLGVVSQTPGILFVGAGIAPLRAVCHREGHAPVTTIVQPALAADALGSRRAIGEGQGSAEWRPLSGGRYPDDARFALAALDPELLHPPSPDRMRELEERGAFHAARLAALRDECRATPSPTCGLAQAELERERDAEMASLDPTLALVNRRR